MHSGEFECLSFELRAFDLWQFLTGGTSFGDALFMITRTFLVNLAHIGRSAPTCKTVPPLPAGNPFHFLCVAFAPISLSLPSILLSLNQYNINTNKQQHFHHDKRHDRQTNPRAQKALGQQTPTDLPTPQPRHDRLLRPHDLERPHVHDQIRITRSSRPQWINGTGIPKGGYFILE